MVDISQTSADLSGPLRINMLHKTQGSAYLEHEQINILLFNCLYRSHHKLHFFHWADQEYFFSRGLPQDLVITSELIKHDDYHL